MDLMNEFFEAAKRREPDEFGNDPSPYFLYIDEFQNFVSIDVADMLDQVAKRGLFVTLAHQRFGQLDDNITDAALTNCHIKAVFGGLPFESARRTAEELAIIDPKKVKVAIYQTKFWPQYERDTVYTRGSSHSNSHQEGASSALGASSGSFFNGEDWFDNFGSSDVTASSRNDGSSDSEIESEADIPIIRPVPFEELSNLQTYTPEEQYLEFAAALKHQFPRHCFIKIHQRETQPMLVPFVEEFYTPSYNLDWYADQLFSAQRALTAAEVDALLKERDEALEELAQAATTIPEDFYE
jgi:TraM recognition site of TraD and TraG